MYRVPLAMPAGMRPIITQPFGPTKYTMEPPGPHGEAHFHYGVDLALPTDVETYGLSIVSPFPSAHISGKQFQGGVTTFNNSVDLTYTLPDGTRHMIRCYHVNEISSAPSFAEAAEFARVGNNGLVSPQPSMVDPFAGAHLHLEFFINDNLQNPQSFFDFTDPYLGSFPSHLAQEPRADWLIAQIQKLVQPFTNAAIACKITPK